jgi:hypothetical protein
MDAKLNITYAGMNGDLEDPIPFDMTDDEIIELATEAVQSNSVPGIDEVSDVSFVDFVVERFEATDAVPFARILLRPKTPFGE